MTISDWLIASMKKLHDAGVDSPRRDALVLLEDTIQKDRTWVTTHPEHSLQGPTLQKLDRLIKRRINREPLAYIRGKAWFWGRFFKVTPDVMIPRPESEAFITLLKELHDKTSGSARRQAVTTMDLMDVGTGSGCLAITAKLEFPAANIIATDTSPKALQIAKHNAKKHNISIRFFRGSLLEPLSSLSSQPSAIMANLPYVPDGMVTSPEITTEPAEALFAGQDGLDTYRQFWNQVKKLKQKPQHVLTESLAIQHEDMAKLAQIAGYELVKTEQLVQLFQSSHLVDSQ